MYDKINFFIKQQTSMACGGIRTVSKNFEKNFLTFLGLGTNVVKVISVNSDTFVPVRHPIDFGMNP